MLNIAIMDADFYNLSGLSFLITEQISEEGLGNICFMIPSIKCGEKNSNVIFRDNTVTINFFKTKDALQRCKTTDEHSEKVTIHIPFLTKNHTLYDLSIKIRKILEIACADYNVLVNKEESIWNFGLKKYRQLSDAENDVMVLMGRGFNSNDISRMLSRSPKTINTHYRNASRKIGVANRAEFYRYASFIAECGCNERNTLCL